MLQELSTEHCCSDQALPDFSGQKESKEEFPGYYYTAVVCEPQIVWNKETEIWRYYSIKKANVQRCPITQLWSGNSVSNYKAKTVVKAATDMCWKIAGYWARNSMSIFCIDIVGTKRMSVRLQINAKAQYQTFCSISSYLYRLSVGGFIEHIYTC